MPFEPDTSFVELLLFPYCWKFEQVPFYHFSWFIIGSMAKSDWNRSTPIDFARAIILSLEFSLINFWFVCRYNCASISMLIIHQFKTYFCMTFSIWRRVTWSLWIFEKMTFWNFWFVLNCASISMFNIWVFNLFWSMEKGIYVYI